jgi:hypothetical protein
LLPDDLINSNAQMPSVKRHQLHNSTIQRIGETYIMSVDQIISFLLILVIGKFCDLEEEVRSSAMN